MATTRYRDRYGSSYTSKRERDRMERRWESYGYGTSKILAAERIRKSPALAKRKTTAVRSRPIAVTARVKPKAKATTRLSSPITNAIKLMPRDLQPVVREIAADPQLNQSMMMLMQRASEFKTPAAALLSGIALDPLARMKLDTHLDSTWNAQKLPTTTGKIYDEVIIGAGLHASIYCGIRAAKGKPKPLVLERKNRVGGIFAVSQNASFFLNSRNRPGPLSIPSDDMGALNVLPGSMVQPSDLNGSEYQTNDALAYVIRLSLAMNANIITEADVASIDRSPRNTDVFIINLRDGQKIQAKRVVIATGLSDPNDGIGISNNPRILQFEQFMQKMDDPWSLRGIRRIAVIGAGDGGRTVIESLTGQGPARPYSIASLDYPDKIDWYGVRFSTCESWRANVRSRYGGIARLLPSEVRPNRPYRVQPLPNALDFSEGYECVYVEATPYDMVIDATGYISGISIAEPSDSRPAFENIGRREVGKTLRDPSGSLENLDYHIIGPAANLPVRDFEIQLLNGIDENKTSLFRYAPRTAMLAYMLD